MNIDLGYVITFGWLAFLVLAWVIPNDLDVARVCANPDRGPWWPMLAFAVSAPSVVYDLVRRDWPLATGNAIVAAMTGRILWHWWRRRRKGKPSRILSRVRDAGHKLTVVAIPAGEGA